MPCPYAARPFSHCGEKEASFPSPVHGRGARGEGVSPACRTGARGEGIPIPHIRGQLRGRRALRLCAAKGC